MNEGLSDFSNGFFRTIAYCPVQEVLFEEDVKKDLLTKAFNFNAASRNDWDLHYFYSILATSSWNKNFDVFDPMEMWKARHSAENKPLNWQHEQENIIGHILANVVVNDKIDIVPEDTLEDAVPEKIHIVTKSALYKIWENPEKQKQINSILEDMSKGNLYVSMECLFSQFDFALANTNGETKILERTPRTAYLSKYLRTYGGPGKYQDYTIGRLLRRITFSAHGLVFKPANPDSIISSDFSNCFSHSQTLGYITLDQLNADHEVREITMAETKFDIESEPAYKLVKAELDSVKAKLDQVMTKTLAEKDEEIEKLKKEKAYLDSNPSSVQAEKDKKAEGSKPDFEEMKKKKTEAEEDAKMTKEEMAKCAEAHAAEMTKVKAELDAERATRKAYEEASRSAKRTAALREADPTLDKTKASAIVEQFKTLGDDVFNTMVETVKGYASNAPKQVTAEQVVTKVKAEEAPPLGVSANGSEFESTIKAVANFIRGPKKEEK